MTAPPLSALPGLLAGEAAIAELLSADDASVVVPEGARAITLAAIAELSSAPVILVATPTLREAEQLEHDLVAFVGRERGGAASLGDPSLRAGVTSHRDDGPPAAGTVATWPRRSRRRDRALSSHPSGPCCNSWARCSPTPSLSLSLGAAR